MTHFVSTCSFQMRRRSTWTALTIFIRTGTLYRTTDEFCSIAKMEAGVMVPSFFSYYCRGSIAFFNVRKKVAAYLNTLRENLLLYSALTNENIVFTSRIIAHYTLCS